MFPATAASKRTTRAGLGQHHVIAIATSVCRDVAASRPEEHVVAWCLNEGERLAHAFDVRRACGHLMSIVVELRDEHGRQPAMPDPYGGTFDSAGDFDRLLPLAGGESSGLRLLQDVDPFGDTIFNATRMSDLIDDIAVVDRAQRPVPSGTGLAGCM